MTVEDVVILELHQRLDAAVEQRHGWSIDCLDDRDYWRAIDTLAGRIWGDVVLPSPVVEQLEAGAARLKRKHGTSEEYFRRLHQLHCWMWWEQKVPDEEMTRIAGVVADDLNAEVEAKHHEETP